MPVSCTPNDLAELAACLDGLSPKQQAAIQTYLLCQIANTESPTSGPAVYRALLTQTGVAAPVATVLENGLSGTPAWSYLGVGAYQVTLTGAFTLNKTFYNILAVFDATSGPQVMGASHISANAIVVTCGDIVNNNGQDGFLINTPFEILVYP